MEEEGRSGGGIEGGGFDARYRGFSRDIGRIIRRLSDGMSNEAECTAA